MKNELRIGNLLYNYGTIVSVSEIKEWTLIAKTQNMGFVVSDYKEFEPIQLTEDILLKCGFINEDDFLELSINEDLSIIWVGYLGIMIGGHISLLVDNDKMHQLQNLYWCLCGKELEINL